MYGTLVLNISTTLYYSGGSILVTMLVWALATISAALLLALFYSKVKKPAVKPGLALAIHPTVSLLVLPYIAHLHLQPIKKKKKKKLKKPLSQTPILELPHDQASDSEEQKPQHAGEIGGKSLVGDDCNQNDNLDSVIKELELIRSFFPNQLKEVVNHSSQRMGTYQIELSDSYGSKEKSEAVIQWKYTKLYPKGGLEIRLVGDSYLARLDKDIIKEQVETLREGVQDLDNPLFAMLTNVFARMIQLGRPANDYVQVQKQEQPQDQSVRLKQQESMHRKSTLLSDYPRVQDQKPQLQSLVNQMFFYPHDLLEAPKWQDSSVLQPVKPGKLTTQMRYKREFQQIKKIGEGGFGRVYLAKNIFDQNTYAIKKCFLNETDPNYKKTIKEVTLLSQLNHPNIVRYHQSWTEEFQSIQELIEELEIDQPQQKQLHEQLKKWKHDRVEIQFADSEKESQQSLEDELDRMQDLSVSSQGIVFGNESHIEQTVKAHSEYCDPSENEQNKSHLPFKILYIAMEYCGQHTLRDWIQRMKNVQKNKLEEDRALIFREILEALVYIHDRKIIHRDLKPANIFWDQKTGKIKLGDFGVATNLNEDKFGVIRKDISEDRIQISDKTKGVGTPIYRAPQQFKSGRYNQKVDIFSLGIIMFEMYYNFSTKMERQILITQLKGGVFPTDFKNIEVRNLVKSLASQNPGDRPSARSLLMSVRNNFFGRVVSTITNPRHFQFQELLNCIFKIKNNSTKTFSYEPFHYLDERLIEDIFQCHGGSNLHLSPLLPVQDYFIMNKVKVSQKREGKFLVITQQGVVMQISNNAYQPWIHWLLSRNCPKRMPCLRRYSFAQVLSNKNGLHKQKKIGVFDLIYPMSSTQDPLEYQCQVIRMSLDIHGDLHNTVIQMGHSRLLSTMCLELRVNEQLLYGILSSSSFKDYDSMLLQTKLSELKKYNLDEALCHRIVEFLDITGVTLDQFSINLIQCFPKASQSIKSIISYLQQLNELLAILSVESIQYRVGIPPQHSTGIYWRTPKLTGFASQEIWQREQLGSLHLEVELTQLQKPMPEVYVWSVGEYLRKQILQIVGQCWDAGLHAEWSKYPRGEKVENIKVGVIIKRGGGVQKKVLITIKSFQGILNPSIETSRQHFSTDLIQSLLKGEKKNEATRFRVLVHKQSNKGKD